MSSHVRHELSENLRELDQKSGSEQAEFWKSCAITQSKELEEIGGLAPDEIYNDVLNRFFDSSVNGLRQVFDLCVRDQSDKNLSERQLISKEGLQDALVEHFQYYRTVDEEGKVLTDEAAECFNRFCDVVGVPASGYSFAYAVRRLRLGILLKLYPLLESSTKLYHFDYDDDFIHTPFNANPAMYKQRKFRGKLYHLPVLEKQAPMAGSDLETYFFQNKMARKGNVHWVHLHRPEIEVVLALGQVYRMPGTVQSTMRNMRKSQPQIHLNPKMRRLKPIDKLNHNFETLNQNLSSIKADSVQVAKNPTDLVQTAGTDSKREEPAFEWSSLIYPGMAMDYASERSLEDYEKWYRKKRSSKERGREDMSGPPSVLVSCVEFRVAIIWSDRGTNSIVTACGPATYIGKWITDTEQRRDDSETPSLVDRLCCCCRRKAPRNSDLGPKYGSTCDAGDEDVEALGHSPSMKFSADASAGLVEVGHERGMEAVDEETSCITFDSTFEKTLQALATQNSSLRTGNNEQLMTRIILNSTHEFVKISEIYEAAVSRLSHLLDTPGFPDKDDLIAKIEDAKLELAQILRLVEPFRKFVLPTLEDLNAPSEIAQFNLKSIQNDINTFVPKCEALLKQCISLSEEYDRKAADKMNSILNILTFITFVITPLQILTGLYGMNFRIIPELEWHHGYVYFWCLSIFLSLLFAGMLYKFKQE